MRGFEQGRVHSGAALDGSQLGAREGLDGGEHGRRLRGAIAASVHLRLRRASVPRQDVVERRKQRRRAPHANGVESAHIYHSEILKRITTKIRLAE